MSYIRCLSNPEGLYVYEDLNGNISWNSKVNIPRKDFKAFLKEFGAGHGKLGNIEIRERKIPRKTKKDCEIVIAGEKFIPCNYKDCLYYKGKLISKMWRVTWVYIARNMMKTFGIK